MRRVRTLLAISAFVVAVLGGAGCSSQADQVRGAAVFDDVADLANGAPVMMSDIRIGHVTGVHLDRTGTRARVSFVFRKTAQVPAAVEARVRRTTALGEKFVDLQPLTEDMHAPLLQDGAVIQRTKVVPDVEQLVGSGTQMFEALSASQIAILLDEGARSFGGKAPQLRQILSNLSNLANAYRGRTDRIKSVIADLDHLSSGLAPAAKTNLDAIANLNQTALILNQNNDRFFTLVRSLNNLATVGDRMLRRHLDQIRRQFTGLRAATSAIAGQQAALGRLLSDLPKHNQTMTEIIRGDFGQLVLDIIVCGLPGGGEVKGDPTSDCHPTMKGK
ncbi:MAG: MCE-family lipoprotein LprK (MCE-family lipoprotein Mce1e) [Acidimicrobiales bacterium]|nr:MCE-family lipoprotein LprK (MCE-family lipoprotein Mce1e) [Acidimicrobiales bacterium]